MDYLYSGLLVLLAIAVVMFLFSFFFPKEKAEESTLPVPAEPVEKPKAVTKAEAPFKPERYLPITKKVIVQECKLSPTDFANTFITQTNDNRGYIECIQEQLDLITKEYRKRNLSPIYLMCTKKALAGYLNITTTKLNKYFKGEGESLNTKIEQLLTYDDKWNISRLNLPS